jgi:hypothetical protein
MALEQAAHKRFTDEAAAYLRARHVGNPITKDAGFLRFIDEGAQRAANFGIMRQVDVIRFLEVQLVTGANFESSKQYAWVADYLREEMDAEKRLDIVMERLRFGAV